MNSTSPHSKILGSNLMNARESGSTMPRRSGVCSGNQSSHRLSVCVVSPRNDEHCSITPVAYFERCHSISASLPSRFVVEFTVSSFVMYNHPPYILKRLNVPSTHWNEWTTLFSVMQAALFRVLVLYNPLESRTGAMDYFYCPAFTTESSHQISCLPFVFHKTHQVYVVLVYFPSYCVPVMSLVPHKFPLLIHSSPPRSELLGLPD